MLPTPPPTSASLLLSTQIFSYSVQKLCGVILNCSLSYLTTSYSVQKLCGVILNYSLSYLTSNPSTNSVSFADSSLPPAPPSLTGIINIVYQLACCLLTAQFPHRSQTNSPKREARSHCPPGQTSNNIHFPLTGQVQSSYSPRRPSMIQFPLTSSPLPHFTPPTPTSLLLLKDTKLIRNIWLLPLVKPRFPLLRGACFLSFFKRPPNDGTLRKDCPHHSIYDGE